MTTKHLVYFLVASLMVNAFLGGMMLSRCVDRGNFPFPKMGKDFNKGDMGPPREDMFFQRMTEQGEKLSPEGQKQVGVIVDKYKKAADKNGMDDKHKLFDEIHATMTAPVFDKAKIEKLHEQLNSGEDKFKDSVGKMMIEIASTLSTEDRINFFEELFPPHPPMDKNGDDHRDDRKDDHHGDRHGDRHDKGDRGGKGDKDREPPEHKE